MAVARTLFTVPLQDAIGYRVRDADGRWLGRLAWLRYGFVEGELEALMLRRPGWRGVFSQHERAVGIARVKAVDHAGRRIEGRAGDAGSGWRCGHVRRHQFGNHR